MPHVPVVVIECPTASDQPIPGAVYGRGCALCHAALQVLPEGQTLLSDPAAISVTVCLDCVDGMPVVAEIVHTSLNTVGVDKALELIEDTIAGARKLGLSGAGVFEAAKHVVTQIRDRLPKNSATQETVQ